MDDSSNSGKARRAKITPENREEARKLKAIWDSRPHPTQAEFGDYYGLGMQANVGHYLNGRSALNLRAALAFAHELKCKLSDFSPRLDVELKKYDPPREPTAVHEPVATYQASVLDPRSLIVQLGELLKPLDSTDRKAASAILHDLAQSPETADEMARKFLRLLGELPVAEFAIKATGTNK